MAEFDLPYKAVNTAEFEVGDTLYMVALRQYSELMDYKFCYSSFRACIV